MYVMYVMYGMVWYELLEQISNRQPRLPGKCWLTKWWICISSADIPIQIQYYHLPVDSQIWTTDGFPVGKLSLGVFHMVSWKSTGAGIPLAFILPEMKHSYGEFAMQKDHLTIN